MSADARGEAFAAEDWLDPRLEVRRSRLDGEGVFAREAIGRGEVVVVWGGTPCTRADIEAGRMEPAAAIGEDLYLSSPKGERGPSDFMNHSCDPNCWMRDAVTIETRCDVAAGQELTADYAFWEADEAWIGRWTCSCGAPACRRLITGKDWRLPELQASYGAHFSPFILRRIEREGAASPRGNGPLALGPVHDDGPSRDIFAERGGRIAGRVTLAVAPPEWAGVFDPIVVPGEDVAAVSDLLVRDAVGQVKARNVKRIELVLEDFRLPYLDTLRSLVAGWGFRPAYAKCLYVRDASDLDPVPDEPGPGCRFAPVANPEDPRLVAVLARVLAVATAPTNVVAGADARALLDELAATCRAQGTDDWTMWELLCEAGNPVGAVLPGFLNGARTNGGLLMIGVVPERRGVRLGELLFRRGLARIAAAGVKELYGSTDTGNLPMIRLFESLGYRLRGIQYYFEEAHP